MKNKLTGALIQFILGAAGFALIWIFGSWQLALGIFLLIWGNNMMMMDNTKNAIVKVFEMLINSKQNNQT